MDGFFAFFTPTPFLLHAHELLKNDKAYRQLMCIKSKNLVSLFFKNDVFFGRQRMSVL